MATTFHLVLLDRALDLWHSFLPRRAGLNMDLKETLDSLGQRINRWYPEINHGGCCVYAALIGEELRKRNIEVRVIVAAWGARKNLDKVRTKLNNANRKEEWNGKDVYFNHVGVEFVYNGKTYHYDSDGVKPKSKNLKSFSVYPGRLSVDEARALADEPEGWNSDFNRSKIPSLKRHIRSYLAAKFPQ
jgi:hypothetical protein